MWKEEADGEHLHKVSSDGELVRDLGTRNAKLESIANGHRERRAAALAAHDHWSKERQRMEKLNVGHQVGRLLVTPVKVLNVLWERRLMGYYTVIGTYAMYAHREINLVRFKEFKRFGHRPCSYAAGTVVRGGTPDKAFTLVS